MKIPENKPSPHPGSSIAFPLAKAELGEFKKNGFRAFFAPVDIASVVLFRMLFGAIMMWEIGRYFYHNWIFRYWIEPKYHFTYWPFDFLNPLPGNGMYWLFGILAVLATCIMLGYRYRLAVFLFFIGFTYSFLLEQTRYLNHFYLIILISLLLFFIPAHHGVSIDASRSDFQKKDTIPAWCLWVLRFTIGLPYFFGGVAKINKDWLLGEPMRSWLHVDMNIPFMSSFFSHETLVLLISYSGLLLDLLIVPLLLIRHTRKWAFIASVLFHLLNTQLFQIGIFPWFMLVATSLFFPPSWPRDVVNFFSGKHAGKPIVVGYHWMYQPIGVNKKFILLGLALWASVHVVVPLRHWLFKGNVHWTEEGHKYAWHMKLRTKKAYAVIIVKDKKSGEEQEIDNRAYVTSWQERKMAAWPNLLWQYCRIIKNDFQKQGKDVAVYPMVFASLNGRQYQQLIYPQIDLASAPRAIFYAAPWIFPLYMPLDQRSKYMDGGSDE